MLETNKSNDFNSAAANSFSQEKVNKKSASLKSQINNQKRQATKKLSQEDTESQQIAKSTFGCSFEEHLAFKKIQKNNKGQKGCPVCNSQVKYAERFIIKKTRKIQYYKQSDNVPVYLFQDLIQDLIADQTDPKERMIKGCQVFMPETAFFKDGKIAFLTQMDKDCCLSFDLKTKMQLLDVRKRLQDIYKERQKDCEYLGRIQILYDKISKSNDKRIKIDDKINITKQDNQNKKGESQLSNVTQTTSMKKGEEKKNQAVVIVKYRGANDPAILNENLGSLDSNTALIEVLNDREISNMFEKSTKAKDFNWKTVEFVQTTIKDPVGIGKLIQIHFFAPLNETNDQTASEEIFYDFKSMRDDLQLLKNQQYNEYCQKQCLKICYYLQKIRSIEVLQMKCEFLRDENSNVWLSYIKDIQIRQSNNRITLKGIESKPVIAGEAELKAHKQTQVQALNEELAQFDLSQQQDKQFNQQDQKESFLGAHILKIMDNHYTKMKDDVGIELNQKIQDDDPDLDKIVQQLRPNSTALNFKDYLLRSENYNKNTTWKQISRKVHEQNFKINVKNDVDKTAQLIQNGKNSFFSSRVAKGTSQHEQFQKLDVLINSLNRNNSEQDIHKKQKIVSRPKDLYSSLEINQEYQSQPIRSLSGLKQLSTLKGDLIRQNLVYRTDLMKIYQPPVKRSQLIENNPFYNVNLMQNKIQQQNDPEYRKLLGKQEALTYMSAQGKNGVLNTISGTKLKISSHLKTIKKSESSNGSVSKMSNNFSQFK